MRRLLSQVIITFRYQIMVCLLILSGHLLVLHQMASSLVNAAQRVSWKLSVHIVTVKRALNQQLQTVRIFA